jgi:hypothetical protein
MRGLLKTFRYPPPNDFYFFHRYFHLSTFVTQDMKRIQAFRILGGSLDMIHLSYWIQLIVEHLSLTPRCYLQSKLALRLYLSHTLAVS